MIWRLRRNAPANVQTFLGENFREWLLLDEESRHALEPSISEYKKFAEAGKELFQELLETPLSATEKKQLAKVFCCYFCSGHFVVDNLCQPCYKEEGICHHLVVGDPMNRSKVKRHIHVPFNLTHTEEEHSTLEKECHQAFEQMCKGANDVSRWGVGQSPSDHSGVSS